MLKKICIIGAGNIGRRHLQALADIKESLSIEVIDPSENSLKEAKKTYDQIQTHNRHQLSYLLDIKEISNMLDIAIIATTADVRGAVTKQLLSLSKVKYIIFEKLLFQKYQDYNDIKNLLAAKECEAWVNCNMRTTPFYADLKKHFNNNPLTYIVNSSQQGLATNSIHYIDHMAYLTNCYDFTLDTSCLDTLPIESKRKGFLELTGTLNVYFKNGSSGSFTNYPNGNVPFTIEILSQTYRCLIRADENKSFISSSETNWKWNLEKTPILYQSQMTNLVVSDLLKNGSCKLTPFAVSIKMHLDILNPLLKFLNKNSQKKYKLYPFT